jgi:hypothetical protein
LAAMHAWKSLEPITEDYAKARLLLLEVLHWGGPRLLEWCKWRRGSGLLALDQSALLELVDVLKAADAGDVVRHAVEAMFQVLIDAEATAVIGAGPHERTPARVTQRNGYRDRLLTTAAGDLELRIPKLRTGSFFPSLLERRGGSIRRCSRW